MYGRWIAGDNVQPTFAVLFKSGFWVYSQIEYMLELLNYTPVILSSLYATS